MKIARTLLALATASALSLGIVEESPAQAAAPLALKTYSAPESSFFVSSTLITGRSEAVLVNAQFTRSHAHRVVADILEAGKTLTTVYISAGDPDYYFGLDVIKAAFPQVRVLTAPAVRKHIDATLQKKLETWGPRLGANGPSAQTVVLPEVFTGDALTVDGERIEIRQALADDAYHLFLWIPSVRTVLGGVDLFGPGMHVWQADAPTVDKRAAWRQRLAAIAALQPVAVVPGHFVPGKHSGTQALQYTRDYLDAIEAEQAKAAESAALVEAMKRRYPDAQLPIALDLGAKVIKGEMKW